MVLHLEPAHVEHATVHLSDDERHSVFHVDAEVRDDATVERRLPLSRVDPFDILRHHAQEAERQLQRRVGICACWLVVFRLWVLFEHILHRRSTEIGNRRQTEGVDASRVGRSERKTVAVFSGDQVTRSEGLLHFSPLYPETSCCCATAEGGWKRTK